mgnify:CR=1 FL=1
MDTLTAQTEVVLDWLVIDDGSEDETESLVGSYIALGRYPISYVKVPHGGKHRALNEGFGRAYGDWILIVDSDDMITVDGIKCVFSEIRRAERLGAKIIQLPLVVPKAQRQYSFVSPNRAITIGQRLIEEPSFDASLVFGKALMHYRFPEFEGEFFLAESALLFQMINEPVYLSNYVAVTAEYQSDGLSANMRRNRMTSSLGSSHVYQQQLRFKLPANERLRALANFGRFWWHSILRGKRPRSPVGLQQWLVLPVAISFTLIDIVAENCSDRKKSKK